MAVQSALQPSPGTVLPSSQTSELSTTELPHCSHVLPATTQWKPGSIVVQSALQPSLL